MNEGKLLVWWCNANYDERPWSFGTGRREVELCLHREVELCADRAVEIPSLDRNRYSDKLNRQIQRRIAIPSVLMFKLRNVAASHPTQRTLQITQTASTKQQPQLNNNTPPAGRRQVCWMKRPTYYFSVLAKRAGFVGVLVVVRRPLETRGSIGVEMQS